MRPTQLINYALYQTGSYLQLVHERIGSLPGFLGEHAAASVFLLG